MRWNARLVDRALTICLWSALVLAIPLALTVRNPMLLRWRPVSTPAVMLLATAVLLFIGIRRCRQWPALGWQKPLIAVWASVLVAACAQEGMFYWRKAQVLAATDSAARQMGAHMVVGYTDSEALKTLAARGLVGGVFITAGNVKGKSQAAIRAEIDTLQTLRRNAGLPALVVSTDQEGGAVSRMSPPLQNQAPLSEIIAAAALKDVDAMAYAYGLKQAQGLASLGINVNFAPLADLSLTLEPSRFDFRSQIRKRAIDADPARVSAAVVGYARGLEAVGVHATLKHFPGLGRVTADTHVFPAALSASVTELEAADWKPFRAGLGATQSLLMVGHATLTQVDAERPASRSTKVIQSIVRQRWGHDGVLVTDDLTMGAVVRHGLCSAGVEAINAGIDLLLVSYDTEQYFEVFHCLLQAHRRGAVDVRILGASESRLKKLAASIKQGNGSTKLEARSDHSDVGRIAKAKNFKGNN